MNKILIDFENCYGIRKLQTIIDFSKGRVVSIYAPNGTMKTSFSKTFKDYSLGLNSKDNVFKERVSRRNIYDETNTKIDEEKIFVIEPYVENYRSENISTLLVNKKLKKEYDYALGEIEKAKLILVTKLKQLSCLNGRTNTVEKEVATIFSSNSFYEALLSIESEINKREDSPFSNVAYNKIFENKILAFLNSIDIKNNINEYISRYNELLISSKYLKKGFNHSNANEVEKSLKGNGFFMANHSINLFDGETHININTGEELQNAIKQEIEKVFNDIQLQKKFNEIDSKLSNIQLKEFRDYLFENQQLLIELEDLDKFRREIWISYLVENKKLYFNLLEEYKKNKNQIDKIISVANSEKTEWNNVIDAFNDRFNVPFELRIVNKDDVILKNDAPSLEFVYKEKYNMTSIDIEVESLLDVLSQGEKRAFYILNILFEIIARKKSNDESIFVIDDIADSFDYKNKYAIIEYLKEISETPFFYLIILSHNYDFHRTINKRLSINRDNNLSIIKQNDELSFMVEKYQNNPFLHWKDNFHKDKNMFIASIPFIRNIAEFTGDNNTFLILTSLLHFKADSYNYKVSDVANIFQNILIDKDNISFEFTDELVMELIFKIAEEICNDNIETIDLENKIALSIAIRLKSEFYIVSKIQDDDFWKSIEKNQTFVLINKFKSLYPQMTNEIKLLNQVALMTPENIHLNSFMFEPILDLDILHLKKLYQQINSINIH